MRFYNTELLEALNAGVFRTQALQNATEVSSSKQTQLIASLPRAQTHYGASPPIFASRFEKAVKPRDLLFAFPASRPDGRSSRRRPVLPVAHVS